IALISSSLLLASAAQAETATEAPLPSYQQALDAFQAERAKTGRPKLHAADRAIMQRAAEDLATAMPEPGLAVGTQAPDFNLPNAFGERVRLSDLLAEGPVVLTFYRGAWCPYCNLQLRALQQSLPEIEARGAQLVAVTPQLPDKSREQVEDDGYAFEVLSDLDDRVMQAYDLYFEVPADLDAVYRERLGLDLAEYNGPDRRVLPVPATFVIDGDGVIRAAFADVDYRKRMEPAAIIAALDQVGD
ncbi:peroxiredoxin-like family protein, partial [Lamprobacter modestohalophilus]